jgi:uncharacterized membrane protein
MATETASRTTLQRAKEPATPVAGPYGHPFHPVLVTVPIGAWVSSLVFDVASQWAGEAEVFAKGAFWLIAIGIVGSVVAAGFGLMDLSRLPSGSAAHRTGLAHLALNAAAIVLFAASWLLRMDALDEGAVDAAPLAVSAVALVILGASGWLGGKLSYRFGVRVVDEATQAEGYR